MYLGLDRGHFLSPDGTCKPFDVAADGYGRAEGCGMFVLKRLADAKAENDHIYGVIKGVEVNQSGTSHSITHPHSETQADLFSKTLSRAGVDPSSVSVIEAHGTGTQVCSCHNAVTNSDTHKADISGCRQEILARWPAYETSLQILILQLIL